MLKFWGRGSGFTDNHTSAFFVENNELIMIDCSITAFARIIKNDLSTLNNGEEIKILPIEYDALYLINGRRKDAPRMMIEVEKAEFYILTDQEGNDLTYMQNDVEYYAAQVWYYLDNIVFTENC